MAKGRFPMQLGVPLIHLAVLHARVVPQVVQPLLLPLPDKRQQPTKGIEMRPPCGCELTASSAVGGRTHALTMNKHEVVDSTIYIPPHVLQIYYY